MCEPELAISWRSVGDCGVFVAKTILARAFPGGLEGTHGWRREGDS